MRIDHRDIYPIHFLLLSTTSAGFLSIFFNTLSEAILPIKVPLTEAAKLAHPYKDNNEITIIILIIPSNLG
jgi:hypothetical protein